MANPQAENGYIRIANEIWDEVIRRNFSKRQKDILFFIWRLSYGCGMRSAHIPQLQDFELCGVSKTKIKDELTLLEKSRVLVWEREGRMFEINKDYEKWFVSLVSGWDDERFDKLISLNIDRKSSRNGNQKVPETGTSEQDHFHKSSRNGNYAVPETGTETVDLSYSHAGFETPKDSIKDITITTATEPDPFNELFNAFCEIHNKLDIHVKSTDVVLMQQTIALGVPIPLITSVMRQIYHERTAKGAKISTFAYYKDAIMDAWETQKSITDGVPVPEGVPLSPVALGSSPRRTRHQQELDDLKRRIEEEERLEQIRSGQAAV